MPVRLKSQTDSYLTLSLTNDTWYGLLELAQEYGWNPLGAFLPGQWSRLDYDFSDGWLISLVDRDNGHGDGRLVVLEDALNLADALERAFMDYEPVRLPASFFLFEPLDPRLRLQPSLGAMRAVIDISRLGAFWIERYARAGQPNPEHF